MKSSKEYEQQTTSSVQSIMLSSAVGLLRAQHYFFFFILYVAVRGSRAVARDLPRVIVQNGPRPIS